MAEANYEPETEKENNLPDWGSLPDLPLKNVAKVNNFLSNMQSC